MRYHAHACTLATAAAVIAVFGAGGASAEESNQNTAPAAAVLTVPGVPVPRPSHAPGGHVTVKPKRFVFDLVATQVQQYHGAFPATYAGAQSLASQPDTAKTVGADLLAGARIGKETGIYVTGELDQGFGIGYPATAKGQAYNGTLGAAGYVSAESYKVGRDGSYGRINRAFIRQTFNFGDGERAAVEPDVDQLGGSLAPQNLILTAGKFSVVDVFDTNPYAHDPSNDFLNWSVVDMGSFDYAADAWGYTYGASAELTDANSTLRGGLFQLSTAPNQIAIESQPLNQYQSVLEFEQRTSFFGGHAGAVKVLAYADTGYMGSYADALALAAQDGGAPFTGNVRNDKHTKFGAGLNLAQEVAPGVGVFARASAMNGTYEAYDFTDIDRSLSAGVAVNGRLYHRANDGFGIAAALNGLSDPARRYFAAGGSGLLIGDGALSYGGERIVEAYYRLGFARDYGLSFDYQNVANPAYNTARGPVNIFGTRYHVQL